MPTTLTTARHAFDATLARRRARKHAKRREQAAPAATAALRRLAVSSPEDAAALEIYIGALRGEAATYRIALGKALAAAATPTID